MFIEDYGIVYWLEVMEWNTASRKDLLSFRTDQEIIDWVKSQNFFDRHYGWLWVKHNGEYPGALDPGISDLSFDSMGKLVTAIGALKERIKKYYNVEID